MILPKRQWVALVAICLTLALCGVWAWQYLDDQRSAASAAAAGSPSATANLANKSPPPPPLAPAHGIAQPRRYHRLHRQRLHRKPAFLTWNFEITSTPAPPAAAPMATSAAPWIDLSLRFKPLCPRSSPSTEALLPPARRRDRHPPEISPSDSDGGGWAAQITLTYPLALAI